MVNPVKHIKDLSYGTGYWTGQIFVIPYLDGLMDSVEPHVKKRFTFPTWVDTMMRSIFQ